MDWLTCSRLSVGGDDRERGAGRGRTDREPWTGYYIHELTELTWIYNLR